MISHDSVGSMDSSSTISSGLIHVALTAGGTGLSWGREWGSWT